MWQYWSFWDRIMGPNLVNLLSCYKNTICMLAIGYLGIVPLVRTVEGFKKFFKKYFVAQGK